MANRIAVFPVDGPQKNGRAPRLALVAALSLLAAVPARAAPTCQTRDGATIRCGAAGAMPAGWVPTAAERFDQREAGGVPPTAAELVEVIALLGGLMAVLALMPPFDGRDDGDWDGRAGDDDRGA